MLAKLSATFACGPRSRFPLTSRFVRSRVRSALALTVASFRTHRPQPLSAPFHVATADLVTDGALLFTARAKNVGSCREGRVTDTVWAARSKLTSEPVASHPLVVM